MHNSPDAASTAANPIPSASSTRRHSAARGAFVGLAASFALASFAALLCLAAWTRQFAFLFGSSALSTVTVLAAYLAGFALGARIVQLYLERVRRPVFVFGALTFAMGLSAVLVPTFLGLAERLLIAVAGSEAAIPESRVGLETALHFAIAFVVLVIPAGCLGATLPLLVRHLIRRVEQIGRRIGTLYAAGAIGALAGTLAAAFLLLPVAGLQETIVVAALVTALVLAIAILIARSELSNAPHPPAWTDDERRLAAGRVPWRERFALGPLWILPILFVSGAASLAGAVLWIRMLSHALGDSAQASGLMIACILLGAALGSAASILFTRSRATAQHAFIVAQIAVAAATLGAWWSLQALIPATTSLSGNIGLALLGLMPTAIFAGAALPLAVRILADDVDSAAGATARVWVWSALGAAVGVLLAGLLIIPALRFEGAVHVTLLAHLLAALAASLLFARPRLVWGVATALIAAVAVFMRPPAPANLLLASPLGNRGGGELHYYGVGHAASVLALEREGALHLRTNGLPHATIDFAGTPPRFRGETWLSPLACIARPATKDMLILGYGDGTTVQAVPPSVRSIDVIEIEPQVLEANGAIRTLRASDPQLDPRVSVIFNDARRALTLTLRRYDAIVSQPAHPWTSDASPLYTREFLSQARAHLTPEGVFVQWVDLRYIDEGMLRALAATLLDVFPHVRIYRPDPQTAIFLGSAAPLDIERSVARNDGHPISQYPSHYARFGIHTHEDLLAALVADRDGVIVLARGAERITDNFNRLATVNAYRRGKVLTPAVASGVLTQYDPLQRRNTWAIGDADFPVAMDYLARRMALFEAEDPGTARRLQRLANEVVNPAQKAYVAAIARRVEGDIAGSLRLLQESVALDPEYAAARFELLRGWLAALGRGDAPADARELAEKLPDSAAAVIEVARHASTGDWHRVPALEGRLRDTDWTDAWYLETVQARVEWRARVTAQQLQVRLGREALALLDEVLAAQPTTPALLALRAQAARSADEPAALIESLQGFARGTAAILDREARLATKPARDTAQMSRMFDALLEMLDAVKDDKRVRAARLEAVRATVQRVRERIAPPAQEK